jgi:hypothetical protein
MNTTSALVLPNEVPLSLDLETKNKLVNWEDFVGYYLQLTEAANSFSWIKADVLLALSEKFGDQSLEKVSTDIGEPRSTVVNYVRTARAFPPEKREASLSFSHHFQASFADSYDERKGEFSTDKRFDWVETALEKQLSTRDIRDEIQEQKERIEGHAVELCSMCGQNGHEVQKFVFFIPNSGKAGDKFKLHPKCYARLVQFISNNGEKTNDADLI